MKGGGGLLFILSYIARKFRGLRPIFNSPIFKIPLLGIIVAFIIYIVKSVCGNYKICREVIDI